MRRLPIAAFWALIVATVAAFFITQHLKVTTPLIAEARISPEVINPLTGKTCAGVDHRRTTLSFSLLYRADDVDVYVVDDSGDVVRTLATGRHVGIARQVSFVWDGSEDDGATAPDGVYHFRVGLIHQGRTFDLATEAGTLRTVDVTTAVPHPMVDRVSPQLIPQRGVKGVTIHYSGNENRGGTIVLYRTDVPGVPRAVKTFATPWHGQAAVWDGKIHQRPAPAGIYLVGLDVTDAACNTGYFPVVNPPSPGSTPHAGVTVRYLAAQPPLVPVPAGSTATVFVDSREHPYNWVLTPVGGGRPVASGSTASSQLGIPVPSSNAGLYRLSISYGAYTTSVPLVVGSARPQPVLVVLPALTWQGRNISDEDGDGLPDTLLAGYPVRLERPLAGGMPADLSDEAALLEYLERFHRPYDLTTDLGLIEGVGPALGGHAAVVLAGSERWLPRSLLAALRTYVLDGGRILSVGLDSLRADVEVRSGYAIDPSPLSATDALGATFGPPARGGGLITAATDDLGIFAGTSGALSAPGSYEPITGVAHPAQLASEAVNSTGAVPIVGYRLGRGIVVDIALDAFGSTLARDVDAQELLGRIWTVLSR